MTAKEFLSILHQRSDKRKSFNTFIKQLRHAVAMEYGYITSAVDYEQIVLDLADLGEINEEVLLQIEWKENKE